MEKHPFGMRILKLLFTGILVVILCSGCMAPTYPKEELIESLKKICKQDHEIEAQAKLIDNTLVVFLPLEKLFDENFELLPEAITKIEKIVMVTSRIIFSTDAEISFFMVIAADTKVTAAELILIKYVEDVYKLMHSWISTEEYRRRVLWQISFDPRLLKHTDFDFDIEPLTLPVFLTKQIAQRFNAVAGNFGDGKVGIDGEYKEDEKVFFFSLVAADDEAFYDVLVPKVLETTASVLEKYKFSDFEKVNIINLLTRKTIIVNREELKQYIKK
ncbi:MAG: hypothetical protein GY853_04505 [PVC group bacterium]|nr:hypothetical protein [PVC group bacterium]